MTTWRTRTDTEWADERTVIDPRSLDTGSGAEQPVPSPLRTAARFKRSPRLRLPNVSLSRHKTTLGFAGLGVALILVTGFAVREHREANALREALRVSEANRVEAEPSVVDSMPVGLSRGSSLVDPQPAALLTPGDRVRAERQATDFIVAHNYDAAVRQLEVLRNAFPEHRAYSDLIDALRWELGCEYGALAGGHRCN